MFAGLAAGLFGVGGGLVIVPVLHSVLLGQGHDGAHLMHIAIATSLAIIITTSISSGYAHYRKGAVAWQAAYLLSPGIILGAVLGGLFASSLPSSSLGISFAVFELLVAASLFTGMRYHQHALKLPVAIAAPGGTVIGFISGIVGIGGGTMTVPLMHWHGYSMKAAIATSAVLGFPIALSASLTYIVTGLDYSTVDSGRLMLGYIDLAAFLVIASSSFIVAPIGARLTHRLREDLLRVTFACLLCILAITVLVQS